MLHIIVYIYTIFFFIPFFKILIFLFLFLSFPC